MQDYNTYTTTTTTNSDPAALAAISAFFMAYFVFVIIIYLVFSFILSKVFVKADKPAWAAFVPIYNGWVLFEIGGKPGWWVLSSFIPFAGPLIAFVLYIMVSLEIAKKFGKSSTFGILGLWLFSIIGYAMLAFDDSKYDAGGSSVAAKSIPSQPEALADEDDSSSPSKLVQ